MTIKNIKIEVIDRIGKSDEWLKNIIIEACKATEIEPEDLNKVIIAPNPKGMIINLIPKKSNK